MPDELRHKLEASAAESGRSLNAEVVLRLETSFTAPSNEVLVELRDRVQLLGQLVESKERETRAHKLIADSQQRLIAMLGMYLRLAAERIPPPEDPVSDELVGMLKSIGSSIAHGDIAGAIPHIERMIKLGVDMGVFDEGGNPGPNHPSKLSASKKLGNPELVSTAPKTDDQSVKPIAKRIRRTPLKRP